MKAINNLIIHCSDTPYGRNVTVDDLTLWHMFPMKNSNGTYTYLGKKYNSLAALPKDKYTINGKVIAIKDFTSGRGWSVKGYSDMITNTGELVNVTPYDFDGNIDNWEVTNGAAGVNSISRHCVIVGGGSKVDPKRKALIMPVEEVLNEKQIEQLISYIRMQKEMYPKLKVMGHNNVAAKSCPNFDVKKFLIDYKV